MKIDVFALDGTKTGNLELSKDLFETKIHEALMHEAVVRQHANARAATAKTKTRSEVKGGGRKPWKQKGTGRARQGSIRSAQWRGGGIIFGPRGTQNFEKQMPKKMRRKALLSALTVVAKEKKIAALEDFSEKTPKTKIAANFLKKIGADRRTLIVIADRNEILEKSFRNLQNVKTIFANYLNVVDLLSATKVVFLKDALLKTETLFGKK